MKDFKENDDQSMEMELKLNDPDFFEIYENFTGKEVLKNCTLSQRSMMLVILASLITSRSIDEYKVIVNQAISIVGISPIEIKEVLYQSIPYVGMSKIFEFLKETNNILKDNNITLPLESQSTTTNDNRIQKGYEKQIEIFGKETIDSMTKNSPKGQEHFQTFLQGYCFGDFYTRTGLDVKDRELITFSIISTLGGCENQLRGHVQGNLNVGNDKETLVGVATILMPYIGFPRTLNTLNIINEICK